jgi:glycosyltransferase involved in cell wall biosynthesis
MRIYIPMIGLSENGGVKVIFKLADYLKNDGHEVFILTFNKGSHEKLNFSTKANIKYIELSSLIEKTLLIPVIRDFVKCWYLFINLPNCDLAIANYFLTAYPVWLSRKPKYKLYYCQAFEPKFFYTYGQEKVSLKKVLRIIIRDPIYRYLAKKSYKLGLFMVANNETIVKSIKVINKDSSLYIPILPPGVDTSIFKPKCDKNNELLKVGVIASSTDWKGTKYFFEAVSMLKECGINFKVICAFPPKGSQSVNCQWVNPRNQKELADFYRNLDVLVSPILIYNEFPLSPLEAMACSVAVISTSLIYGEHKIHYYEVPPKDSKAIVNALIELTQNPDLRKKIANRGDKLSKDFDWEVIGSKLRIILKEYIGSYSSTQKGVFH